jgi:hypothetical protein
MHVTRSKFTNRAGGSHNINLLTPTGRRAVDIRLVRVVYLCFHCLGRLKYHNAGVQCELNQNHYGYIHRDEADKMTDEERFVKLTDMFKSEYLRGIDIGNPVIVTIKGVTAERASSKDGRSTKEEFVMRFGELDKKLRLNLTMAKEVAKIVNDPEMDTDNWTGRRVTLYRTIISAFGEDHIVVRIRKPESGDVDLAKAIKQAQPKGKQATGGDGNGAWKKFLTQMKEEFDFDEAGVKAKLKELNYTGFTSDKAGEMYESIKVLMSQQADPEQSNLFEEAELSDELKAALAGGYSEDM